MRLRDLPKPQMYTRQERFRAQPPGVLEASGFHTESSLAVYQGLLYYLLWLHSKYDKVGAWCLGMSQAGACLRQDCRGTERARSVGLEKPLQRAEHSRPPRA